MIKRYVIKGMTGSACASGIEQAVFRLDGVKACEVSLVGKSIKVDFDERILDEEKIFSTVKSLGYDIFYEGERLKDKKKPQAKELFIRFVISSIILVPLLYVSVGATVGLPLPPFMSMESALGMRLCAVFRAVFAALIVGINFSYFKDGVIAIFKKAPNKDTLVALGAGVAFIYSAVYTVLAFTAQTDADILRCTTNLHFTSAGVILTLAAFGKWLNEKSRRCKSVENMQSQADGAVTAEEGTLPYQNAADRAAGIFVPFVVMLALLTFIIWLLVDGSFIPDHCVTYAINVLVVSCPCALVFATPVSVMAARDKAASLGITYKNAEVMQKLCDINAVLLDKTVLTEGKPHVTEVISFGCDVSWAVKMACGMEQNSDHPLARCIVEYAGGIGAKFSNFEYIAGKGAKAFYKNKTWYIGNVKILENINVSAPVRAAALKFSDRGDTVIYFADKGGVLAVFGIADEVGESSAEAVSLLKSRNMRIAMLTGDSNKAAQLVADRVGIAEFAADTLPPDRLAIVENLQKAGGCVAMVGGVASDFAAVKQADVGIAMGNCGGEAKEAAEVVIVSNDLKTLDTVFDLSNAVFSNVRQNFFWAAIYNMVMVPMAGGALSVVGFTYMPILAAACLCLSSMFVIGNALRLLLYKNKRLIKGK